MKIVNMICLALCAMIYSVASGHGPNNQDVYTRHTFTDSLHRTIPYRLLTPPDSLSGERYPLVVFLHGSGERGDDNEKQLTHGASIFSNPANVDKYPAYVVFPQCHERAWTDRIDEKEFMSGSPEPAESSTEQLLIELVRNLIEKYPIDIDRIYIVGISMGGIATYDLVCRYPELFSAAVPICGAVNPDRLSAAKDVKFLIFHGEVDDEIPSLCSREAYKALAAVGADVDYVEFAGVGHECWTYAFNYPTLLQWLFAQHKSRTGE